MAEKDVGEESNPYKAKDLSSIGVINPKPGERPPYSSSILEIDGDNMVSVETPSDVEMNIIRKPLAKVDSPMGEALLSAGLVRGVEASSD